MVVWGVTQVQFHKMCVRSNTHRTTHTKPTHTQNNTHKNMHPKIHTYLFIADVISPKHTLHLAPPELRSPSATTPHAAAAHGAGLVHARANAAGMESCSNQSAARRWWNTHAAAETTIYMRGDGCMCGCGCGCGCMGGCMGVGA